MVPSAEVGRLVLLRKLAVVLWCLLWELAGDSPAGVSSGALCGGWPAAGALFGGWPAVSSGVSWGSWPGLSCGSVSLVPSAEVDRLVVSSAEVGRLGPLVSPVGVGWGGVLL